MYMIVSICVHVCIMPVCMLSVYMCVCTAVDSMYSAMSQCQAMHPDTDDDEDEQHQLGEGNDSILMENISKQQSPVVLLYSLYVN